MSPDLSIRPATPDDSELIAKMVHELAVYERAPEECTATGAKIRARLVKDRPDAEALIAEVDGKPAGFALFFHNFSTWEAAPGLYLEDIFVRPAYRRKNIGEALVRALARIAVERGCRRMDLSVLDWNKPARDFYEKLGGKPLQEWVPYRFEAAALADLAAGPRAEEGTPVSAKKSSKTVEASGGEPVVIHTDGGSRPNPGVGAWAAVLRCGDNRKELVGGELGTTNNRMELSAAVEALRVLKRPSRVVMHTDSQYVKNGITSWIANWKKKGWKRGDSFVKNVDLWKALDEQNARHQIEWAWVKGHAGDEENERCDELCAAEIERLIASSTPAQRKDALEREKARQDAEAKGKFARRG